MTTTPAVSNFEYDGTVNLVLGLVFTVAVEDQETEAQNLYSQYTHHHPRLDSTCHKLLTRRAASWHSRSRSNKCTGLPTRSPPAYPPTAPAPAPADAALKVPGGFSYGSGFKPKNKNSRRPTTHLSKYPSTHNVILTRQNSSKYLKHVYMTLTYLQPALHWICINAFPLFCTARHGRHHFSSSKNCQMPSLSPLE